MQVRSIVQILILFCVSALCKPPKGASKPFVGSERALLVHNGQVSAYQIMLLKQSVMNVLEEQCAAEQMVADEQSSCGQSTVGDGGKGPRILPNTEDEEQNAVLVIFPIPYREEETARMEEYKRIVMEALEEGLEEDTNAPQRDYTLGGCRFQGPTIFDPKIAYSLVITSTTLNRDREGWEVEDTKKLRDLFTADIRKLPKSTEMGDVDDAVEVAKARFTNPLDPGMWFKPHRNYRNSLDILRYLVQDPPPGTLPTG